MGSRWSFKNSLVMFSHATAEGVGCNIGCLPISTNGRNVDYSMGVDDRREAGVAGTGWDRPSTVPCSLGVFCIALHGAARIRSNSNEARRTSNSTEKKTLEIKNRCVFFLKKISLLCLDGFGFPPGHQNSIGQTWEGRTKTSSDNENCCTEQIARV